MSVKILLMRTKTHRSGNAIEVELVDPGEGNICAVSLLRQWFDRLGLWRQPESPAFPSVNKSRNGGGGETVRRDKHFSRRTWSDRVKKILTAAGLEPRLYSDHGFRAGGATDLFDAGMTLTEVMEFGRWKTAKSCLRYYRRGYGLANKVAAAFIGHRPKTLF
jgi:integrase